MGDKDRYMSPDIKEATDLLRTEKIWNAVKHYMERYHEKQNIETRVFSPAAYTFGEQRPRPQEIYSGKKRKSDLDKNESSNGTGYAAHLPGQKKRTKKVQK